MDGISGISENSTALKTVAAIGSTTLKADAVPAERCFIDHVKRKYGITKVTIPSPMESGIVTDGDCEIFLMSEMGLLTTIAMMLMNIKL
jgi:hypothetical protein